MIGMSKTPRWQANLIQIKMIVSLLFLMISNIQNYVPKGLKKN